MRHQRRHETVGRARAPKFRVSLDMNQGVDPIAHPVCGMDLVAGFVLFETLPLRIVEDHDFWELSRYIHGKASPMGMIQSVPARA